jgi:K+-transporting ATPase KdpF subunit
LTGLRQTCAGLEGEPRGLLDGAADHRRLRAAGTDRPWGGKAVTAANLVGLILAIGLSIFLIIALLFPEKF